MLKGGGQGCTLVTALRLRCMHPGDRSQVPSPSPLRNRHAPPPSPPRPSPPLQAAARVLSQLKRMARGMYSSPPTAGAKIAAEIVNDPEMFAEWKQEMMGMSGRIATVRRRVGWGREGRVGAHCHGRGGGGSQEGRACQEALPL